MIVSLILGICSIGYVGIVFYLYKGWQSIPRASKKNDFPITSVSILIAARNEEQNIGKTLQDILLQEYPKELIEIIVVDDHSTDATAAVIRSFQKAGVKLIQLKENKPLNSYKKLAITEAVKESGGELLVATDADCRMGPRWLSSLVSLYREKEPQLISAPVAYQNEENLFERMQTLEFLFLIGLGAAGIGNRKPSTCNGANLAYRREVFDELKGFQGIDHVASGDDELFMHKVADRYPGKIEFCKSSDAIVYTQAKESMQSFINQRKRWASKSMHYKNKSIVRLGISIWIFNITLLLNSLLALIYPELWLWSFIGLSLKFIVELIFMIPLCRFVRRTGLLVLLPILTVLHIFYIAYIGIMGNIGSYQWKGRSVR